MAVRPIDGNALIHRIGEIPLEYEHRAAVSLFYKMIESMPTLTPPNEPLTCAGCIYNHNRSEYCDYCVRRSHVSDYYRRPPDRQEDADA